MNWASSEAFIPSRARQPRRTLTSPSSSLPPPLSPPGRGHSRRQHHSYSWAHSCEELSEATSWKLPLLCFDNYPRRRRRQHFPRKPLLAQLRRNEPFSLWREKTQDSTQSLLTPTTTTTTKKGWWERFRNILSHQSSFFFFLYAITSQFA